MSDSFGAACICVIEYWSADDFPTDVRVIFLVVQVVEFELQDTLWRLSCARTRDCTSMAMLWVSGKYRCFSRCVALKCNFCRKS